MFIAYDPLVEELEWERHTQLLRFWIYFFRNLRWGEKSGNVAHRELISRLLYKLWFSKGRKYHARDSAHFYAGYLWGLRTNTGSMRNAFGLCAMSIRSGVRDNMKHKANKEWGELKFTNHNQQRRSSKHTADCVDGRKPNIRMKKEITSFRFFRKRFLQTERCLRYEWRHFVWPLRLFCAFFLSFGCKSNTEKYIIQKISLLRPRIYLPRKWNREKILLSRIQ